jgi:hypothetical protein
MNKLLARILDAHGGIDCWNRYEKVEATIVSGGGFFRLKGVPQDSAPRRILSGYTRNARLSFPTELPMRARYLPQTR